MPTVPDQYLGTAVNPATLHRYAYANGDPVHNFDPTGYVAAGAEGDGGYDDLFLKTG